MDVDAGVTNDELRQPFSQSFAGLISQPVPFGVTVLTIQAARLTRNEHTEFLPGQTYAELDVSIQNNTTSDLDYSSVSTWDLVLADGTRIPSANTVGIVVAAGYAAKTTMYYPVNADATLAGSQLVIDGDTRGVVEPEPIPLDATWSTRYPIDIPSLKGATYVSSDQQGEIDIEQAATELDDATMGRTALGQKFLRLDVATISNSNDVALIGNDSFRLIVDGLATPPVTFTDSPVESHASLKFPVVFEMDDSVQTFDLRLSWNSPETFHVALPSTGGAGRGDGGASH